MTWTGGGLDVCWPSTTCPLHVQPASSPRPASVQPTFIPQVNDLPMHVENCNLYADDTMIEAVGKTIDEVVEFKLINYVHGFHNRLTVNASKSCSMIIGTRQRLKNISLSENIGLTMNNEVIINLVIYPW